MRYELGPSELYVANTVDGDVPGSVVQAHTVFGGVHVHRYPGRSGVALPRFFRHPNEHSAGDAAPTGSTSIRPRWWITASVALVIVLGGSQCLRLPPSGLAPRCAKVKKDLTVVKADPGDDTKPSKRKYRGQEVRLMVDQHTVTIGGDTYRGVVFESGHDGRGWMPSADLGPEGSCDKQYY